MRKKRISMSVLQALARKIEKEFDLNHKQEKIRLRQIIILYFNDDLGYDIYYEDGPYLANVTNDIS